MSIWNYSAFFRWTPAGDLDDLAEGRDYAYLTGIRTIEGSKMSLSQRFALTVAILVLTGQTIRGAEKIDLTPNFKSSSLMHVTIDLDAGGHNLIRNPNEAKEAEKTAPQELPSSVSAKLGYDELRLASEDAPDVGTPVALRYYDVAEAVIKVGESGSTPKLSDDRRLIVLEQAEQRPLLRSAGAPLDREQLDLIDAVGDSYTADRLLPGKSVAEGESWTNGATVMGPLLTFDTVAVCEVQSVLDSFNENFAKIRLAGTVHGTADGAAVEQEVRGVYLFDRRLQRVSRLNLAVREKRSIGGATPGLEAVAKVQVAITPIEKSSHLGDDVLEKLTVQSRTPAQDLSFESPKLGFRIAHDRQWYVTGEARESITMRRVDNGDLAAQCTITQLPPKSEGRQTSLEQFQKDVTFSLGKSFGELVSSRQYQNAAGHYCYELVVRGFVEELPVEWHYYLVAPESGARVSVVVTIEKSMVERVGTADRDLVESLHLFPAMPPAKTAAQPTGESLK